MEHWNIHSNFFSHSSHWRERRTSSQPWYHSGLRQAIVILRLLGIKRLCIKKCRKPSRSWGQTWAAIFLIVLARADRAVGHCDDVQHMTKRQKDQPVTWNMGVWEWAKSYCCGSIWTKNRWYVFDEEMCHMNKSSCFIDLDFNRKYQNH